ncbi:1-phosphofructokinase [Halomonas sp. McH1-25]|uniref:1-phosphofructokinase n=1 Tax=unclassified Halomonas TaxID=2609666 RepID=UPI001EF50033|nr:MULTISPECIES: 1-phosphofructokinase [unclassified Halomonas]MCG7600254.1 1-phosphofructokinase [Halomonas sp. McH1-25]MCP1343430.1 1-phosphofructokinase [Halomonas sp. FL8]MCP1359633.1 1-phosphofructokinase [Halomonas sp. BBD45]
MARILTISLNPALDLAIRLPRLSLGSVNRTESTRLDAAGKGVNVARVLVALGHDVAVSGFLGAANDGPFVHAFADLGVADAFLRVPGETRINAKVAEHDGRVTDINGPGLQVGAEEMQQLLDSLEARANDADHRPDAVVIAGSLPPGVTADDLALLIERLQCHGLPVWVDTSGSALQRAIAARPTAVKPNEQELAEWAGEPLDSEPARLRAARRLHAAGIDEAVISAGGEGVLWISRRGAWLAVPPEMTVTSTVGAGDTLVAGMLHGVLEGLAPERALQLATALSAESVRHVGVGDPTAADFDDLQQRTRVRRLDDTAGEHP